MADAQHLKIGVVGELSVRNHLKRKGYIHLESNFRAKTGEIDIILEKDSKVHFIEVKTVSCATYNKIVSRETYQIGKRGVSYETNSDTSSISRGTFRPEDNIHRDKLRKILNTIQVWMSMNKYKGEWQLDIAAVYLDTKAKSGKVRLIENAIVE